MYKDIFESVRNEAKKRNLRERTIIVKNIIDYYLKALYIPVNICTTIIRICHCIRIPENLQHLFI